MPYSRHDAFIAPAQKHPELWRFAVGLVVLFAVYLGAFLAFGWLLQQAIGDGPAMRMLAGMGESDPWSVLFFLATFVGMVIAAFAAAMVHKRGPGTLFGPMPLVISDFLQAGGLAIVVFLIASPIILVFVPTGPNMGVGTWLVFLPLALPLILLQTGAEELAFRGYLQQQLAARFARPAVWLVLPAAIFAAGHIDPNTQGNNWWAIAAITGLFGVIAADITARSGSIGAAWGLHFVNNVQAILLFSLPGPLDGLALRSVPLAQDSATLLPLLFVDALALVFIWLAWRRLRRD
ncbi:MAG: type II CAAX endopeptidase family protein [Pseudomonadota bacterium]